MPVLISEDGRGATKLNHCRFPISKCRLFVAESLLTRFGNRQSAIANNSVFCCGINYPLGGLLDRRGNDVLAA